ncbi:DUF6503 family protein [Croceivirga thetidis]|uniref:Threonine synthase n=1 Tax=Croceivirga thetidis TaxID=2721623 RepID=A0ABX1GT89_9FLAO|nr:DUF6503 family protein [Croceivirga thetidis]NKI32839.1 hypothetical protein [Croceivirga thetidis]
MRHLLAAVLSLIIIGCKPKPAKNDQELQTTMEEGTQEKVYPEELVMVLEAHGGLDLWKNQRTLSYVLARPDKPETHITDLWTRFDRIEMNDISMGYDGKTWLLDPSGAYKGNPEFYHNLMFYFYAMPFVLADDGINYAEAEVLRFEGKEYPGIQITYNSGVGTSPKDEYYIHYNPESHKMEWLGYTVTYRTGEDSDNIKWIRYNDWGNFDGLILPNSISWYNYEGREIKDLRNTVEFEEITLSSKSKSDSFYAKPIEAEYFVRPE